MFLVFNIYSGSYKLQYKLYKKSDKSVVAFKEIIFLEIIKNLVMILKIFQAFF